MQSIQQICKHAEERRGRKQRNPRLKKSDQRKYMTDRELLDKYIDLDKSCLTIEEKEEVRDLLYEYKDILCRFLILL